MEDHRGVVSNKTRRDSQEIKVQEVAALCKNYNEFNDKKQYVSSNQNEFCCCYSSPFFMNCIYNVFLIMRLLRNH